MMVGDPNVLAIESGITKAYDQLGVRALGFFVLHVSGKCFGVKQPDATLLACSFDEVSRRIAERGIHNPSFPIDASAEDIAFAFRRAVYTECGDDERFFGMTASQFTATIYSKRLEWAPDGDEAFDDGSYVLQLEDEDRVRLVAFKSDPNLLYEPASLCEVSLSTDDFYGILRSWRDSFESEWATHPKVPDGND